MSMTYAELMKEANELAISKGWYEIDPDTQKPNKRSLVQMFNLFHSEVSEMLEAYRDSNHEPGEIWLGEGGKPEGVVVEIADLFIRIADTIKMDESVLEKAVVQRKIIPKKEDYKEDMPWEDFLSHYQRMTFDNLISDLHRSLVGSLEEIKYDIAAGWSMVFEVMDYLAWYCVASSWDLEKAIRLKMEYNKTRPVRHGNKRC